MAKDKKKGKSEYSFFEDAGKSVSKDMGLKYNGQDQSAEAKAARKKLRDAAKNR
jgi:hypothetical protein